MRKAICGLDCEQCWMKEDCAGCAETGGRPFGGTCMIAECRERGKGCGDCWERACSLRQRLIDEFNALGIADMEPVTELNALSSSYVNLEYTLPGGQKVKFWKDGRMILGNQMGKKNSERCYGLAANEDYLLVSEYGENGSDAEIVVCRRREKPERQDGADEGKRGCAD